MKVTSRKPKGQRIYKCVNFNHSKFGKIRRSYWIQPVDSDLYFNPKTLKWIKKPDDLRGLSTAYYAMTSYGLNNAYSLKAVKRLISKWEVPKGTKFRASLPFVGHDFFITK